MKQIVLAFALLIIISTAGAQPHSNVQATYWGGERAEFGYSVQCTADNGLVATGITSSYGAGDGDVWLLRFNREGELMWEQTFGSSGRDEGRAVIETAEGSFIIVGSTSVGDLEEPDIWLIKTNSSGELIWSRIYGQAGKDLGSSLCQTADGGFLVVGRTSDGDDEAYDIWVLKTDGQGRLLWDITVGGEADDLGYRIEELADGAIIVAGYTESYGAGLADICLAKLSSNGELLWLKTYGGTGPDFGAGLICLDEGGFLLAGETHSTGSGAGDMWVIRADSEGRQVWDQTFGSCCLDGCYALTPTPAGGFALAGWSGTTTATNICLLEFNADGQEIAERVFEHEQYDIPLSLVATTDGYYHLTGYSGPLSENDYQLFMLTVSQDESAGIQPPAAEPPDVYELATPYPNPFNNETRIGFTLPVSTTVSVEVFDLSGRKVGVVAEGYYEAGRQVVNWRGEGLSSGVYFIRLQAPDKLLHTRCMLLK